ncbi:MAG TPA: NifB/NifX family molybdenum-iron cluster-binding protein [Prolixibacteraceae bacterium]|nr:NifB/NifX family molybdenum-iron cluster-binding protein [Prolixibacteraceae bacterium]
MRIAIPIDDKNIRSKVSETFARSNFFALVDKENRDLKMVENPFKDMTKGVGVKLFGWLVETQKSDALLAFEMGYKVQQMANDASLQIIIVNEQDKTLEELMNFMDVKPNTNI